ncbi:MAG: hypothetical protein JOZ92_00340 [Candidatus Dormibacteraeota bacterium]|nr:hypothetical protein [Candidatus Dormibacteraeota bacterium]
MGIYNLAWGVVLLPLLGTLASLLAETPRRAVQVCVAFSGAGLLLAAMVLGAWLSHAYGTPFQNVLSFFGLNPPEGAVFPTRLEPFLGIYVDALSAAFSFAVCFVFFAVQAYALTSLRGDAGYRRFAWSSSLLAFASLGLILSPNLFQSMVMWMLGTAAAYLMTLHWWQREDAAAPARRVLTALRASDLALLLATVIVFVKFGIYASSFSAPPGQDISDPFAFGVIAQSVTGVLHGLVPGAGLRTLAVLSALVLFAVTLRAAQAPFHAWLAEMVTAPIPVITAVAGIGGSLAVYVLARVYPVVGSVPHAFTALALTASLSAVVIALVCVAQRDVVRIVALSASFQLSMALIAISGGGFGEGLFVAFTSLLFITLGGFAAGNLVRVFRTGNLHEMGEGWQRMRTTAIAVVVWAAGVGGLALQSYYAISGAFDDANPGGAPFSSATRAVVAALTILAALIMAFAAFRVVAQVCFGVGERRRGFRPDRVAEVETPLRRLTSVMVVGSVLAVLVGLPGIAAVGSGKSRLPALTFIHLVHFGVPAQTALNPAALLIALAVLAAGGAAAFAVFSPARRAATTALVARMSPLVRVTGHDLYVESAARRIGVPFGAAGRLAESVDTRVLDSVSDESAQGLSLVAWSLGALRARRQQRQLAGGLVLVALVVLVSILAATGHLGGVHPT